MEPGDNVTIIGPDGRIQDVGIVDLVGTAHAVVTVVDVFGQPKPGREGVVFAVSELVT